MLIVASPQVVLDQVARAVVVGDGGHQRDRRRRAGHAARQHALGELAQLLPVGADDEVPGLLVAGRGGASAMFLVIVLITGTIALSSPSFMTTGAVQASSDREKDHDNDDKKSYGKDRDRDDKSRDHDKDYDENDKSYGKDRDESSDEEKDNDELKDKKDNYNDSYGKDRDKSRDYEKYADDTKSYGNDDYESKYLSYGKDDNYKSKESRSNSVSIKKVKCNNINVNVNGLDFNGLSPFFSGLAASEAQAEDEGESSYGSYETGYGGSGESANDNNSFKFVCKNNNNNIVVAVNETIPESPKPLTCEDCFTENLSEEQLENLTDVISSGTNLEDLEGLCEIVSNATVPNEGKLFIVGVYSILQEYP